MLLTKLRISLAKPQLGVLTKLEVNCEFLLDDKDNLQIWSVNICKDEELYISYGEDYWSLYKEFK